jgi:hypothetical protein
MAKLLRQMTLAGAGHFAKSLMADPEVPVSNRSENCFSQIVFM